MGPSCPSAVLLQFLCRSQFVTLPSGFPQTKTMGKPFGSSNLNDLHSLFFKQLQMGLLELLLSDMVM